MLGAMAGIARKIELYNLAYRLAWEHISEHQRREHPDIAQRLHDSIRRQVSEGATEAVFIASEALRDIDKGVPRTGVRIRAAAGCRLTSDRHLPQHSSAQLANIPTSVLVAAAA